MTQAQIVNKETATKHVTHVAVLDHKEHRVSSVLNVTNAMSSLTAHVALVPFKLLPLLHAFAIPVPSKNKKSGEMVVAVKTSGRNFIVLASNEVGKASKDLMVAALDAQYSLEGVSECMEVNRKADAAQAKINAALVAADAARDNVDRVRAKVSKSLEKAAKKAKPAKAKKTKEITPLANWPFPN